MVDGISIFSHANKNNDGIDIDSSTKGVIRNCTIDSGDDSVCFKTTSPKPTTDILVEGCKLSSEWGAIKFGTESMGDFKDITVKNCVIHDTKGGGIKILSVDGANISNVRIDSIEMTNVEMPVFIRLGERGLVYRNAPVQPVGSINNVTISNIVARVSNPKELRLSPTTGLFFTGTPGHPITALSLQNITIYLPGGGTSEDALIAVPENEKKYPEFTLLGPVPAYGMFARHVERLSTRNLNFILAENDDREEVVLEDVDENESNVEK